jgi:hypothetical protein
VDSDLIIFYSNRNNKPVLQIQIKEDNKVQESRDIQNKEVDF